MAGRDEFNNVTVTNESQVRGVEFGSTQNNEFSFTRTSTIETNTSVTNEVNEEKTGQVTGKNGRNTVQNNDELIQRATDAADSAGSSSSTSTGVESSSVSGTSAGSSAGASSAGAGASSAGATGATAGVSASAAASSVAAAGTVVVAALTVVTATPVIMSKAIATLLHIESYENEVFYEVELKDTLEDEKYIAQLSYQSYEESQPLTPGVNSGVFENLEYDCDYTFTVIEGNDTELTRELYKQKITTGPIPAHEHTFAEEWSYDESHHWHAATCEHTDEVSDMGDHTFGEWEVVYESTTEEHGLQRRICEVCGYAQEEELPLHVHTFAEEWNYDDNYHWHASTCGHVDEVSEKELHSFGEWKTIRESTTEVAGLQQRTCFICGYIQEEELPLHVHTFSEDWTYDSNTHWHASTCGHLVKSDEAAHDFTEWEIITESTTEEQGLKRRSCQICGYVEEEALPLHEHTFEETWTYDSTYHWHACTCGHDVVGDQAEHDFTEWETVTEPTTLTNGERIRYCQICDYSETESIPMTGQSQINEMTLSETASFYENSVCVRLDYIDDFTQYDRFELLLADSTGFTFFFNLDTSFNGEDQWIEVSDFTDYEPKAGDDPTGFEEPDEGGPHISTGEEITYTFRYYLIDDPDAHVYDTGTIIFEDPDYVPPFSYDSLTIGDADYENGTFDVYVNYTGDTSDINSFTLVLEDESNNDIQNEYTLTVTTQKQTLTAGARFDLEHASFTYTLSAVRNDYTEPLDEGSGVTFVDVNGKQTSVDGITFETNNEGKVLANSGTGVFNVTLNFDDYFDYYADFALLLYVEDDSGATMSDPISNTLYLSKTTQQQAVVFYDGEEMLFPIFDYEEISYEFQYATIEDPEQLITASSGTISFVDSAVTEITNFEYGSVTYLDGCYYLPFKFDYVDDRNVAETFELRLYDPDDNEISFVQDSETGALFGDRNWQLGYTSDNNIPTYISNETEITFAFYKENEDEPFHTEVGTLTMHDDNADFSPLIVRLRQDYTGGIDNIHVCYFSYEGGYCMINGVSLDDNQPYLLFVDKNDNSSYQAYMDSFNPSTPIYSFDIQLDAEEMDADFVNAIVGEHAFDIYVVYYDGTSTQQVLCYTQFTFNVSV